MKIERIAVLVAALILLVSCPTATVQSQRAAVSSKAEARRFTDAGRRSKLAGAFSDIDLLFRGFAGAADVPGAAWGIVIDGELAHTGAVGVRDVATKSPVDANMVFRIASMTKSFTAIAILVFATPESCRSRIRSIATFPNWRA